MRYRPPENAEAAHIPSHHRLVAVIGIMAGCAGGAAAPSPTMTRVPVITPDDAIAKVIANEPRLGGIGPLDTGLIGQSSWYTVEPASGVGAFVVSIRIGWGDCPAGCIDEHTWTYAIGPRGEVTVLSESGPPVPPEAWPSSLGAG